MVWRVFFFKTSLAYVLQYLIDLFSRCSGLVVSSYSKSPIDKTTNIKLSQIVDPYKKYKKNYDVGSFYDYKGT